MSKMHTYYKPTEYEEMLIAAGWVSIGDLDTDYLTYKQNIDYPVDYQEWDGMRREWDELNTRYENEVEPHFAGGNKPSLRVEWLGDDLLSRMSSLECWLGY